MSKNFKCYFNKHAKLQIYFSICNPHKSTDLNVWNFTSLNFLRWNFDISELPEWGMVYGISIKAELGPMLLLNTNICNMGSQLLHQVWPCIVSYASLQKFCL